MKTPFTLLLCVLAGMPAALAQSAFDSTAELQEVVVEASRYKVDEPSTTLRVQTSLIELPQNIQVVTGKTLRDQQIFDMLDGVTRNVSGAMRVDSWDNYASIFMRGGVITAFRNGMNVKMPWGPLVEDMSMVERIEFVKGPSGFMLANGDPTGFYNIVTKKPTGVNKGEVSLTMGSFDHYRVALDLDGKLNRDGKLLYRFNMMGQMKNSHRDFDFSNRYTLAPTLSYQVSDQTSVTVEYTYQQMRMAMLGAAYVFSPRRYGDVARNLSILEPNLDPTDIRDHNLFVTLRHQFDPQWRLTAQLAYLRYEQQGASIWPAYPVGLEANGDLHRSVANWDAFNESRLGQFFLNGQFATGPVRHRLLAGLDMGYKNYYADFYQTVLLPGLTPYGVEYVFNVYDPLHGFLPPSGQPQFDRSLPLRQRGGGTMGESSGSVYVQDELRLMNERLRITLAGRYTKLKQHSYGTYSEDKKITPRAGISFSVNKNTSVYALYDQSFVAQQGADSALRPFVPVTGNNIEAGLKRDWSGGKWNSTLSLYQITRNNVVSVVPGPGYKVVQTGQTKTRGIEADLRGELAKGLNIAVNYAYTHAWVSKDEDASKVGGPVPEVRYADHTANAWLQYRIAGGRLKGWGAGAGGQYLGGRKDDLPDYFRLDGNLSWQGQRFTIGLNAYNLLDDYLYMGSLFEHNNDPSSHEYNFQIEPGIHFRLSMSYRF